jgi:hypothetical protein
VLSLGVTLAWAQDNSSSGAEAESFAMPRTPWGDPDLQGVWDYRTITPLQRPQQFGDRAYYTDEEIAQLEGRAADRLDEPPTEDTPANLVHAQYMTDPGRHVDESRRNSLIIEPANGRIPDMLPAAEARQQAARAAGRSVDPDAPWQSRTMLERCITQGMPRAIMPTLYNNNIEITQGPGVVAITHEMVHDTRVIPLDGSDFTGIQSYMGESRGHWEGDTLVVETRNVKEEAAYRGATSDMRLTERFTLSAPDRLDFRLTVEDPNTWPEPWTAEYTMRPTEGGFYEYACHEGNYGLRNILENMLTEQ